MELRLGHTDPSALPRGQIPVHKKFNTLMQHKKIIYIIGINKHKTDSIAHAPWKLGMCRCLLHVLRYSSPFIYVS